MNTFHKNQPVGFQNSCFANPKFQSCRKMAYRYPCTTIENILGLFLQDRQSTVSMAWYNLYITYTHPDGTGPQPTWATEKNQTSLCCNMPVAGFTGKPGSQLFTFPPVLHPANVGLRKGCTFGTTFPSCLMRGI